MFRDYLLSATMVVSMILAPLTSYAADECQSDKDCKDGKVCILALTPHACKAPQAAGAACKRDAVCASKKCDIPAGKEVGACK